MLTGELILDGTFVLLVPERTPATVLSAGTVLPRLFAREPFTVNDRIMDLEKMR